MNVQQLAQGIFIIPDFLTATECEAFIKRTEAQGFEQASITHAGGTKIEPKIRNNDRVIIDDFSLAGELWTRAGAAVPRVIAGRQARGLNERFRFYRYTPGQKFVWHAD